MNKDFTYCQNNKCSVKDTCLRFILGSQLKSDHDEKGPYYMYVSEHSGPTCSYYIKEDSNEK